ncbi:MAG: ATP-binding cassette domain-containing protein [Chloroflexota bacterium]
MLEVKELVRTFGKNRAVDGVSFRVSEGEAYGLLGPNGAGKSTTINLMLGLLRMDAGAVTVGGNDLKTNPEAVKRLIGFVPQEIALYPTLSARENLAFWGRMYGLGGRVLADRIDEALETVGLTDRARHRIETYSGGMKRRINIAAALLHRPQLLIMDEPTVGIDPQSRNHILETVRGLNSSGMTIIYTSHYMEEVEFLCSRVGIIDHGKIIAEGTLEELRQIIGHRARIRLRLTSNGAHVLERLRAINGVDKVDEAAGEIIITTANPGAVLPAVTAECTEHARIQSVALEEPNLEAVFLHLTGRGLRD